MTRREENVEVVRAAWDAFERGDLEAAAASFDPDLEFDVSRDIWGAVVGGGLYRGIEGAVEWLRDLYGAWDQFEMTAEEVTSLDDGRVITVLLARGRGRTSGIEVEHRPEGLTTLRDGRIDRIVWFASREEALAAASSG